MKIYKKRIIICVRSNMAGSEKYPLPFVGKRAHPLHFSKTKSLPGTYHHIEAVWVICKIALNLWSVSLNRHMTSMKRTVLLLLVGALHTQDWGNLQNVKVESFSANSLWPVDQGIIWAANRISQGALFWDCCKNWSQMKTSMDCPCMMLW